MERQKKRKFMLHGLRFYETIIEFIKISKMAIGLTAHWQLHFDSEQMLTHIFNRNL